MRLAEYDNSFFLLKSSAFYVQNTERAIIHSVGADQQESELDRALIYGLFHGFWSCLQFNH